MTVLDRIDGSRDRRARSRPGATDAPAPPTDEPKHPLRLREPCPLAVLPPKGSDGDPPRVAFLGRGENGQHAYV
jgi:hypothetical protein